MANIVKAWDFLGSGIQFPIKSGSVINQGDLVAIDSNGQVVLADKDTGPVGAHGFAFFPDELGPAAARTGVAALTVKCAIARRGVLNGFTSLTIGANAFLSGTAGGYTTTAPSTNADVYQCVGVATAADTIDVIVQPPLFKFQTSGNSTVGYL